MGSIELAEGECVRPGEAIERDLILLVFVWA
jgi:hypothetical protein